MHVKMPPTISTLAASMKNTSTSTLLANVDA
jgi:hypothetical protein